MEDKLYDTYKDENYDIEGDERENFSSIVNVRDCYLESKEALTVLNLPLNQNTIALIFILLFILQMIYCYLSLGLYWMAPKDVVKTTIINLSIQFGSIFLFMEFLIYLIKISPEDGRNEKFKPWVGCLLFFMLIGFNLFLFLCMIYTFAEILSINQY